MTSSIERVAKVVAMLREAQREIRLLEDDYTGVSWAQNALSTSKMKVHLATNELHAAFKTPGVKLRIEVVP